jgi:hypothetical protein
MLTETSTKGAVVTLSVEVWEKGKVVTVHAIEACRGSGGAAAFIPDLGIRWM